MGGSDSGGPGTLRRPELRFRVFATMIDLVAVLVPVLLLLPVLDDATQDVRLGVLLLLSGIPTFLVEVGVGRSLGKAALQMRHVRPGEPDPDVAHFLPRWGVKWLVPAVLTAVGPWTWAALWWVVDGAPALVGQRRALHDLVAGTRVWQVRVHEQ